MDFLTLAQWAASQPPTLRWTNGDFHADNILRNERGEIRLVDCEFARRTHFPTSDWCQFRLLSKIPPEIGSGVLALPEPPHPGLKLHFWLLFFGSRDPPRYGHEHPCANCHGLFI